jgi:hypothetical protein
MEAAGGVLSDAPLLQTVLAPRIAPLPVTENSDGGSASWQEGQSHSPMGVLVSGGEAHSKQVSPWQPSQMIVSAGSPTSVQTMHHGSGAMHHGSGAKAEAVALDEAEVVALVEAEAADTPARSATLFATCCFWDALSTEKPAILETPAATKLTAL